MRNILKQVILGSLFIIPFLAFYVADGSSFDWLNWGTSGLFFPFITGKNFVFRVLVEVAFAAWVLLALLDPAYRPKKSWILLAYGAFVGSLFVSALVGIDTKTSIWSNFERMEGFVAHVHILLYLVVLSSMFSTLKEWLTMFRVAVWSNLLVMSWGFLQLLGAKDFFFAKIAPALSATIGAGFPIHMSETRIDATIGNSAYYAIYCLFFAGIAALLLTHATTVQARRFYAVVIGLNLISLFYTGTRGTMIALVVAVVTSLSTLAWFEKGKARKTLVISLAALFVVISSIFVFKDTSFIQNSPTLSRFASISPTDVTTMSRLTIWKISYEAWKERPIFGYGQDNFTAIYAERFIGEKMWNLEAWYDRSHNVFFDWLIAGGIVGLTLYLSIFALALFFMWRRSSHMTIREKSLITGVLAGYFMHNVLVFDNLISYILFVLVLAYIVSTTEEKRLGGSHEVSESTVQVFWAPLVGIILAVALFVVVYQPYTLNKTLVRALDLNRLTQEVPFAEALTIQKESFQKAITLSPHGEQEAREQFLQAAGRAVGYQLPETMPQADREAAIKAINDLVIAAREEVDRSYPETKNDVRALSIYGSFFTIIGDYVSAEKVLSEAHALSPQKQLISFDLIRTYLGLKKYTEAYTLAQETYLLAPGYPTAQKMLAVTSIYANKKPEAAALFAANAQTFPLDGDIITALLETGKISELVSMLRDLKKTRPDLAKDIDAYIAEILAGKVK